MVGDYTMNDPNVKTPKPADHPIVAADPPERRPDPPPSPEIQPPETDPEIDRPEHDPGVEPPKRSPEVEPPGIEPDLEPGIEHPEVQPPPVTPGPGRRPQGGLPSERRTTPGHDSLKCR